MGGTSEVLRFIRSEFNNKPGGIGIDVFFGGGLEPYLALKKEQLLRPYALPQELLKNIPPGLGGVPLYDPDYTWYGATLAGFGYRPQQSGSTTREAADHHNVGGGPRLRRRSVG